ncbi:MAG: glycerophosphodiester phosphodiesterase family protein [Candidatus Lernaella stagnicola]|nr:glycerophosphodiester phosphodiesterase family protein [Candidatus Lernaella stagnicola]
MLAVLLIAGQALAVFNQGHRGTGTNMVGNPFPENTIPSFLQAFAEGADMVELDCTLSADDEVVVIHDDSLDRTTDCSGAVYDWDLVDIKTCDAAVGTPLQGTGVEVPTLAEVFAALDAAKYTGEVNVEIKGSLVGVVGAAHLAERVTDEILLAGWEDRIIFSCFSASVLDEVELIDSAWITAYLTSEVNVNAQADLAYEHGFDGLHPYFAQTFAPQVDYAHGLGLFVNVWTLDVPALMQSMINRGVDGIITNDPEKLAPLLDDDDDDTTDDDTTDDDTTDDDTTDDDTTDDDTATDDDDDDTTDDDTATDDDDDDDDDNDDDDDDNDDDDDDNDSGCGC